MADHKPVEKKRRNTMAARKSEMIYLLKEQPVVPKQAIYIPMSDKGGHGGGKIKQNYWGYLIRPRPFDGKYDPRAQSDLILVCFI